MGGGSLPCGRALVSCPVAAAPPALGPQVPPGGNKTQYDEIGIPVALLSHKDMLDIFKVGPPALQSASGLGPRVPDGQGPRSEAVCHGLAGGWFLAHASPALWERAGGATEQREWGTGPRGQSAQAPGPLPRPAGRPCPHPAPSDQRPRAHPRCGELVQERASFQTQAGWERSVFVEASARFHPDCASTALPSLLDDSRATCPLLRASIRVQV